MFMSLALGFAVTYNKLLEANLSLLASCLIYAWALLEYVIFILWVCYFSSMLPSVKFVEDKLLILSF